MSMLSVKVKPAGEDNQTIMECWWHIIFVWMYTKPFYLY